MTCLTMKTYVDYKLISNGGPSEKWTFDRRVFDICDIKVFLASLFSQHVDIGKTLAYEDRFDYLGVGRSYVHERWSIKLKAYVGQTL